MNDEEIQDNIVDCMNCLKDGVYEVLDCLDKKTLNYILNEFITKCVEEFNDLNGFVERKEFYNNLPEVVKKYFVRV